jgi:hypothetical protein
VLAHRPHQRQDALQSQSISIQKTTYCPLWHATLLLERTVWSAVTCATDTARLAFLVCSMFVVRMASGVAA